MIILELADSFNIQSFLNRFDRDVTLIEDLYLGKYWRLVREITIDTILIQVFDLCY